VRKVRPRNPVMSDQTKKTYITWDVVNGDKIQTYRRRSRSTTDRQDVTDEADRFSSDESYRVEVESPA